jgi:beta-1,4-mannosyl-glycoprotein beta-1,4-N-acetylglucosaminyltransferase
MSKIYDCFNFYNELDILELRLNILYDYVDYFVIVESSVTHSGIPKKFFFEENKDRYSKFLDKIINFKVYDTPNDYANLPKTDDLHLNKIFSYIKTQKNRFNVHTQFDYGRDFFQKECIRRAIINCNDDDIILYSDADEIPNPNVILNLDKLDFNNNLYRLNQNMYIYYINLLKEKNWYGSRLGKYGIIKNISLNELRGDNSLSIPIENGGWHFSFMGGKDMIKNKLLTYSARDMVNQNIIESIDNNINNNIDPFFRSKLELVEIDETYPSYLINNKEKYKNLIKL